MRRQLFLKLEQKLNLSFIRDYKVCPNLSSFNPKKSCVLWSSRLAWCFFHICIAYEITQNHDIKCQLSSSTWVVLVFVMQILLYEPHWDPDSACWFWLGPVVDKPRSNEYLRTYIIMGGNGLMRLTMNDEEKTFSMFWPVEVQRIIYEQYLLLAKQWEITAKIYD